MGSLVVVEAEVTLERGFELPKRREVTAPELDPPVVVKDRLLDALDESVGEGVAGLGPGVSDTELLAGLVEDALELASAIREYALH